jgi:hypothetical protein
VAASTTTTLATAQVSCRKRCEARRSSTTAGIAWVERKKVRCFGQTMKEDEYNKESLLHGQGDPTYLISK